MKYISLSFDDARSDTFEYALPIINKYGLTATVNVISDFVINPQKYDFPSAPYAMKKEQIIKWQRDGHEVACHGSTHTNSSEDIIKNIEDLQSFGIDVKNIGFASPESWLTDENIAETGIDELKGNGSISYIRTGIQVRREGILYTTISALERICHSKWLYYKLNKKCIIDVFDLPDIILSTAIKDYTRVNQLKYFVNMMEDSRGIILMFHSILPQGNDYYGADHYFWSTNRFEELCKWLSEDEEIRVLTTYDLLFRKAENDVKL